MLSKTTIRVLTSLIIVLVLFTTINIGGKALQMEFPVYEVTFTFLRAVFCMVTIIGFIVTAVNPD